MSLARGDEVNDSDFNFIDGSSVQDQDDATDYRLKNVNRLKKIQKYVLNYYFINQRSYVKSWRWYLRIYCNRAARMVKQRAQVICN